MHTEQRHNLIDRIYLHTNEGPEGNNSAQGLAHYLTTIDAGYHVIVDNESTVVCAADDQVVWGAGGDNSHSLHVCMIGYASQTTAQWADPYSRAETERAAQQVATWCRQHNVPVAHVRPGLPGQTPTDRGIAKHGDNHDPRSGGHTDPGTGFPIDAFVSRVAEIGNDLHALKQLADWYTQVKAHPLRAGSSSWHVTALKQMLDHIGEGPGNDTSFYGPELVECVEAFKRKHKVRNKDGTRFGGPAALKLLQSL